jgi:glycosyltransferase involved in cell wall biosynthesis
MVEAVSLPNALPKFDRSVSLLCWAYNEEDSIQEYLKKATQLMESSVEDYEIVLIDDGSTDRTYEIAEVFRQGNSRLKIFRNERNLNVGISSQRAIRRASKEFLFWQTIDWCYDISNLRLFLEYLRTYDIVQGVRGKSVDGERRLFRLLNGSFLTRRSDTVRKAIVSLINYLLIRLLFRVSLSDFQNVTFYPTQWVQSIQYESKSSFANPEGLIKSYWREKVIKEVPINFIPRSKGKAKGTKLKAIQNSVQDIFKLWWRWVVLGKRGKIKKGKVLRIGD